MIKNPREKYSIPSLRNACRVLKHIAKFPDGLDLKNISGPMGIPRTTALRICITLESENFLLRTAEGKFTLGSGLAPLGMLALPNADIRKISVPVLRDLVKETNETAHLAVMCGKESLILEVCDTPQQLRVASRPGSLALIHCSATGKIFLTFSVFKKLQDFFDGLTLERRTPNTITTVSDLQKEIEIIRKQGYALDNEEYFIGVRCMAAPVRNQHKHVIASIGITGATARFTKDKIKAFSKIIKSAGERLSAILIESQIETKDYSKEK